MTKREVLSEIMYDLKLKGTADFETSDDTQADSFTVTKKTDGYEIVGTQPTIRVKSAAEVRKAIAGLGRTLVQL